MAANTEVVVKFTGDASGLKRAIDAADNELGQLVRQTDRAQAALGKGLGKASTQAAAGMNGLTKQVNQYNVAQRSTLRSARQSRANLQNLGFQIQDVAVQYEMGTDAARIFAQQGSQIAGIFGPAGAAIGAVLAITAALAPSLIKAAFGMEEAKESAQGLEASLKSLASAELELATARLGLDSTQAGFVNAINEQRALITAYEDALEARKQLFANQRGVGDQPWQKEAEDLAEAREELEKLVEQNQRYVKTKEDLVRVQALSKSESLEAANLQANNERDIRAAVAAEKERLGYLEKIRSIMATIQSEIIEAQRVESQRLADISQMNGYLAVQAGHYANIRSEAQAAESATRGMVAALASQAITAQRLSDRTAGGPDAARAASRSGSVGEFVKLEVEKFNRSKLTGGGGSGGGQSDLERRLEKERKALKEWKDDMREAAEQADQFGKSFEESLGGATTSAIDNFIDAWAEGGVKFSDVAKDIMRDLFKIMLRAAAVNVLMQAFGGSPGNPLTAVQRVVQGIAGVTNVGPFDANAKGNAFNSGNVVPFASGGVISGASMFPMSNGRTGLMGEAGAEAIMPLSRTASGDLGVAGPSVTVNNYSGQPVTVDRSEEEITIAVGRAVQASEQKYTQSMASGQGGYARSLESNYGTRRKAV